jgi:hypothetical protein
MIPGKAGSARIIGRGAAISSGRSGRAFGCRNADGSFCPDRFAATASVDQIKMVESLLEGEVQSTAYHIQNMTVAPWGRQGSNAGLLFHPRARGSRKCNDASLFGYRIVGCRFNSAFSPSSAPASVLRDRSDGCWVQHRGDLDRVPLQMIFVGRCGRCSIQPNIRA